MPAFDAAAREPRRGDSEYEVLKRKRDGVVDLTMRALKRARENGLPARAAVGIALAVNVILSRRERRDHVRPVRGDGRSFADFMGGGVGDATWFWNKFRVSRETAIELANALRFHELPVNEEGKVTSVSRLAVEPSLILLVVLARLADGGAWHVVADLFHRVRQVVASTCVCLCLCVFASARACVRTDAHG